MTKKSMKTVCPFCRHEGVVKFGMSKKGAIFKQRFRCKNESCKKTYIEGKKPYTKQFKLQVVQSAIARKSIRYSSRLYSLSQDTVKRWRDELQKNEPLVYEELENVNINEYVYLRDMTTEERIDRIRNE